MSNYINQKMMKRGTKDNEEWILTYHHQLYIFLGEFDDEKL